MFCFQCGKPIPEGSVFCPLCGQKQEPIQHNSPQACEQNYNTEKSEYAPPVLVEEISVYAPPADPKPHVYTPPQGKGKPHHGFVGPIKAVWFFFRYAFNYKGRATRSEYWWAMLFNLLVFFVLSYFYKNAGIQYFLLSQIPGLALFTRRLHDTGKSFPFAFMGLIPLAGPFIVGIRVMCLGSDEDNRWGAGPVNNKEQSVYVPSATYEEPAPKDTGAPLYEAPKAYTPPIPAEQEADPSTESKELSREDIFAMAQKRDPVDVTTPAAKSTLDQALSKIVPNYTGEQFPSHAMMVCDPKDIMQTISNTDTDTLLVIFKALEYYLTQGDNPQILGLVQNNVVNTLKRRL